MYGYTYENLLLLTPAEIAKLKAVGSDELNNGWTDGAKDARIEMDECRGDAHNMTEEEVCIRAHKAKKAVGGCSDEYLKGYWFGQCTAF